MVQRLIFVQGFLTFCQVRFRGQRHTCYCFFQFSCKRMVKSGSFFSLKPCAHQGESKFQLLRISCFGEGNKQTNLLIHGIALEEGLFHFVRKKYHSKRLQSYINNIYFMHFSIIPRLSFSTPPPIFS